MHPALKYIIVFVVLFTIVLTELLVKEQRIGQPVVNSWSILSIPGKILAVIAFLTPFALIIASIAGQFKNRRK